MKKLLLVFIALLFVSCSYNGEPEFRQSVYVVDDEVVVYTYFDYDGYDWDYDSKAIIVEPADGWNGHSLDDQIEMLKQSERDKMYDWLKTYVPHIFTNK